jgi:hypothetical protein
MKLFPLIAIWVVAGLAVHGLAQNWFSATPHRPAVALAPLHCDRPPIPLLEQAFSTQPDGDIQPPPEVIAPSTVGSPQPWNPTPSRNQSKQDSAGERIVEAGSGGPDPNLLPDSSPLVDEIMEIRQRLGGASIASILANDVDDSDGEVPENELFRQALTRRADSPPMPTSSTDENRQQTERPVESTRVGRVRQLVGELQRMAVQIDSSSCPAMKDRAARYRVICDNVNKSVDDCQATWAATRQSQLTDSTAPFK